MNKPSQPCGGTILVLRTEWGVSVMHPGGQVNGSQEMNSLPRDIAEGVLNPKLGRKEREVHGKMDKCLIKLN